MTLFEWFIIAAILGGYSIIGAAGFFVYKKFKKTKEEIKKYKKAVDKLMVYFSKAEPFLDFLLGK
jgi:Ni/Fe-hydrogenase subunit HybB-like protein